MIPMTCPSCGRRGNIPNNRLNSKLHCKKCDATFYIEPGGNVMLGEPPSAKQPKAEARRPTSSAGSSTAASAATAAKARAKAKKAKRGDNDILAKFSALPRPIRTGIVMGVILLVIGTPIVMMVMGSLPPKLEDRAEYAAKALRDESRGRLLKLATPETRDDLSAWYDELVEKYGGTIRHTSVSDTQQQGSGGESADTTLIMIDPGSGNTLELHIVWILNHDGEWQLDGKTTHDQLASARVSSPMQQQP